MPLSAALRLDFLPDTRVFKGLKGREGSAVFGSPGFFFYWVALGIPRDAAGKGTCWWALGRRGVALFSSLNLHAEGCA